MWTQFWDMHSGGGQKEKWAKIYIEAPEEEARVIFFNRFGHNTDRVTCTCCGPDYSLDSHESLAQLTGFHRNCRSLETPRDPATGLYNNDDPVIVASLYLEDGEDPAEGYEISDLARHRGDYESLDQYIKRDDVLVIAAKEISPVERTGNVPDQGYVWI